ncbi:MAG TPA: thermonuclease family protein [Devosia sp.]|nr:thermonuclease family protein [Devosia sp.]
MTLLAIAAAPACEGLRDGPLGTVTQIVDGDTLLLDSGRVVRLVGIQAPHLALGRDGLDDWPEGETARQALATIALGQKVILRYGGAETDRYGRALAQVFVRDDPEIWVQQRMLATGMARVYSFPDNRACLPELFAAESGARSQRLGIWADPYYTVRRAERPDDLLPLAGHFELVEGRVLKAEKTGGGVYLNFGRRFKEDFTAVIDSRALRLFTHDKIDPLRLAGLLVRIRGWLEVKDGPRIEVSHPEQIEVLAAP